MIAAIYARKSTDQSNVSEDQKSVERQIENAKAFAAAQGWIVAPEHVYVDDAVSGAESTRLVSKQRLLSVIHAGRRPPFDVLVMQKSDRFSRRDGADAIAELKSITKTGVEIWFYAKRERFTYGDLRSNVTSFFEAELNAEFRRVVAEKTREAMERKARAGHVTGGRVFGYDNVEVRGADGKRSHVERRVNDAEAAVVRKIFQLCARGVGYIRIAKRLNDAGLPAPKPRSRAPRPVGWAASSVGEILNRPLYRGVVRWGQHKKRNREGEIERQLMPESQWLAIPMPHLQIVSDDLWDRAQARRARVRQLYLRSTHGALWGRPMNDIASRYLLTGLAVCGSCRGTMEVRSRAHGPRSKRTGRRFFYACATYHRRGVSICRGLNVPMELADAKILDHFEREILAPAVLEAALARVLEDPEPSAVPDARGDLEAKESDLRAQIGRLTDALAAGAGDSRAVLEALRAREKALERVRRDLERIDAAPAPPTPARVREVLAELVADWRATLRQNPAIGRQMIAKLLDGRLVFEAEDRNEQPGFRVKGRASTEPLLTVILKAVDGNLFTSFGVPNGYRAAVNEIDLWIPRVA